MVVLFLYFLEYQGQYLDQFSISRAVDLVGLIIRFCVFSGLPPFLGFFCKYILFSRINNLADGLMSLFIFFFFSSFLYCFLFFFFFFFLLIILYFFIYIKMMFKLNLLKWFYIHNIHLNSLFILIVYLVLMVIFVII